jgi:hypothetical protein
LKSARLIPAFSSLYCAVCWYLANSACQSAADSGGTMPVTGCHSVIDRPDQVSRVMPPITTIAKIIAQQTKSQIATARRPRSVAFRARGDATLAEIVTP